MSHCHMFVIFMQCLKFELNTYIHLNLGFAFLLAILLIMFLFLHFNLNLCFVFMCRLDLAGTDVVSLSANHLQKLRFSFQLTTPHGHAFKPRQVCCSCIRPFKWMSFHWSLLYETFVLLQALLKLKHETKYEHIFVVGNTGKKFEIIFVKYLLLYISLSRLTCLLSSTYWVCYNS